MKYSYKKLIALLFVAVLCALFSVVAYAADPLTAGLGWAGMAGSGVTIGGMAGLTANQFNDVFNSQTGSQLDSYLNDPNNIGEFIKFGSYTKTIDDVEYSDIWISHDFASYIQSEGFGYIIDKSINPNSSGVIAEGVGFVGGVPIYLVDGTRRSVNYYVEFPSTSGSLHTQIGDWYIHTNLSGSTYRVYSDFSPTHSGSWTSVTQTRIGEPIFLHPYSNSFRWGYTTGSNFGISGELVSESFDFTYISSDIITSPIDTSDGLRLWIPSSYLPEPSGQYFIDGAGNDDINILTQSITQAVNDGKGIDIVYEPEEVDPPVPPPPIPVPSPVPTPDPVPIPSPVPTPEPVPTTPIDETTLQDILQPIIDGGAGTDQIILDESHDIQSTVQETGNYLGQILEKIRELIHQGFISVLDALELIRGLLSELVQTLENVLEAVITHPLDLFGAVLDGIGNFFGGAFGELKRHLGIWHYVVEWIASISGVFAWIFAICNSTSYYIVLPIYALVAAAICLALYKRFGR